MDGVGYVIYLAVGFAAGIAVGISVGISVGRKQKPWSELNEKENKNCFHHRSWCFIYSPRRGFLNAVFLIRLLS